MQSVMFWGASTLYAVASFAFFWALAFRKGRAEALGLIAVALGIIPHAVSLALRWVETGHGPYSSRYEVLSANAFLAAAIFLGVALALKGLRPLGALVLPSVFLMMGWAVSAFGVKGEVPIIFKSYWLFLHVAFAKAFFAFTLIAAASAAAYLLKASRPTRLERLPPAERLDLYAHQFLLLGFLCLGVMIAAGSLWAHQSWGRYWAWDPIETTSLVTWIAFGAILHFRILHGWSGRRMAWLTFAALALAVFTLYIVVLVVPTIHNFYMVGPKP